MSRVSGVVVWGLVPLAVGAAVAWLVPAPPTPAAPDPDRAAVSQPTSRGPTRASPPPNPRVVSGPAPAPQPARCDALERQLATLDGLVGAWFGEGAPWPEEVADPVLREEGFAAWMEQVATEMPGVGMVEVDCAQYPCVGVWRVEEPDTAAFAAELEKLEALQVAFRMLPIQDEERNTSHWIVAASVYEQDTVEPASVKLRMNAALSANGWNGYESVDPDDPEASVPFFEEL